MKKIELDLKTEKEINELSESLKALPRRAGGTIRRVPEMTQNRIVRILQESGMRATDLAGRLGITGTSIATWAKHKRPTKPKPKKKKRTKAEFTEIKIRPEKRVDPAARGLTLELPGGAKVHGLALREIRELLLNGATQ